MVWVVAAAGAACAIAALWLPGGAARPDLLTFPVLACVAALVAAAGIAFAVRRTAAFAAAGVLAAGAAGLAGYLAWSDHAGGLPGRAVAVLAAAALCTALGILGCAAATRGHWPAAALVVAAAVAAGVIAPGLPVTANTAADAPAPPDAQTLGKQAWTWRTDGLREVVVAGHGVVAASGRAAVTALDGASGEVRWRYERAGAHLRNLAATPDRALVLAAFAPGGLSDEGTELLVTIDATTGAVLTETTIDGLETDDGFLAATNRVRPIREPDGDDLRMAAYDLRTGEPAWTWAAPEGCASPFMLASSTADVVLVNQRCPDGLTLLALDDRTGQPRWSHMAPSVDSTFYPTASADGSLVAVRTDAGQTTLLRAATGATVTTSRESIHPEAGVHPLVTTDRGEPLKSIDAASGTVLDLPESACPDPATTLTTESALLYPCGASLVSQPLPSGEPSLTPGPDLPGTDESRTFLNRPMSVRLLAAPGAIVLARATTSAVTGYASA